MRTLSAIAMLCLLSVGRGFAEPTSFVDDFQEAVSLYQARRYEPAQTAFLHLAERAPSPASRAECLGFAASILSRQGKYEPAMKLADTIEPAAFRNKCRMALMLENKDERRLIAEFAGEAIDGWPEAAIPQGYYLRGQAYLRVKDYAAAVVDLENAVRHACDAQERVEALLSLAGAYRLIDNAPKAMESYRKILESGARFRGSTQFQAVLGLASLLNERGESGEALRVMKQIDLARLQGGDWHLLTLSAYGDIYGAVGNTNEALASYRAALNVPHAQAGFRTGVSNKIDRLTGKQEGTK